MKCLFVCLFVCIEVLHPSQQFFSWDGASTSRVLMCLCWITQHDVAVGIEPRTSQFKVQCATATPPLSQIINCVHVVWKMVQFSKSLKEKNALLMTCSLNSKAKIILQNGLVYNCFGI